MNKNMTLIDALIGTYFLIPNFQGLWQNSVSYTAGQTVVDETTSVVYTCLVPHTSTTVPTTFAQDRAEHESYWGVYSTPARARGIWAPDTVYAINDFVTYQTQYAISVASHTSGSSFTTDRDAGKWSILVDLSAIDDTALPIPSGVIDENKIVRVNGTGNGYIIDSPENVRTLIGAQLVDATLTVLSGVPTSAFGRGVLAWATSAAGRTALEVYRNTEVYTKDETLTQAVQASFQGPNVDESFVPVFGVRYDGFPKALRAPGRRRIGTTINSTIDHTGSDEAASIKIMYSDQDGAEDSWVGPTVIFGEEGDEDCYTNVIGVDHDGLIHFWCRERTSGFKYHRTTRDWETFSDIDTIETVTIASGGDPDFTIANFRLWGKFMPDPSGPGMIGAGYWIHDGPDSRTEVFYVVTDAAGTGITLYSIAASAEAISYNETAVNAPSGSDRMALVRWEGTNTPKQFKSTDSGLTWTDMGEMGFPPSGGWLPQELHTVHKDGVQTFVAVMGNRRPSGTNEYEEPYPGPGVSLWFCPVKEAFESVNGWKMGHAKTWTYNATYTTDAYCSMIIDPITHNAILFSYDELSNTRADVFCWRPDNIFEGVRTPSEPDYLQSWQVGGAAFLDREDIVGGAVETITGAYTLTSKDFGHSFVITSGATLTLPLAADVRPDWYVRVKGRGATATVTRAGADTIDGTTSITAATGTFPLRIQRSGTTSFESF
jgi:hypothetical protein